MKKFLLATIVVLIGLAGGGALGRPVDIKIQPDGKIYISDDKAGVIYLVEHH